MAARLTPSGIGILASRITVVGTSVTECSPWLVSGTEIALRRSSTNWRTRCSRIWADWVK